MSSTKVLDPSAVRAGKAIVAKTLNTMAAHYIEFPQRIYLRLKADVDVAADYGRPRAGLDLDPAVIKARTIQLAIPEATSPAQWRQLVRATTYAQKRGVTLEITRIRS